VLNSTRSWIATLFGLACSDIAVPDTVVLVLATVPDACFPNLSSIHLLVINRPASGHSNHISIQPAVEISNSVCAERLQRESNAPLPAVVEREHEQCDQDLGKCETQYVDSNCINDSPDDISAVKDDYWKWDVDRQRFVHRDKQTGEETLCPEWFD
ncbi:hypothetical protein QBC36DRAFT_178552, partial [Triangularia setosa]